MNMTIQELLKNANKLLYNYKLLHPSQYNLNKLNVLRFMLKDYYKYGNDWKKYTYNNNFNDDDKQYYKNTIYLEDKNILDINTMYRNNNVIDDYFNNYNLKCSIISWKPLATTNFHNHLNTNCIMMPLKGILKEDVNLNYYISNNINDNQLNIGNDNIKTQLLMESDISYIDNDIGDHKITNIINNKYTYSIHLYEEFKVNH
jgi:hypothetical protein